MDRQRAREAVAAEHGLALFLSYSEKQMAQFVGWDYSTAKRKRKKGEMPYVDRGGGSVAYLGYMIADIILFGAKAKEPWANTPGVDSNAETGGLAPNPDVQGISAARSRATGPPRQPWHTRC